MKLRGKDILRERLAGAYVLGTLRGHARRRFEGYMHDDAALRRTVAEWNERLGAMAEFVPARTPPMQVWRAIERRLGLRPKAPAWQFWRHGSLGYWRTLGVTSSMLAALLLVAVMQDRREPVVSDIATLTDEQSRTALLVLADRDRERLDVRLVEAQPLAPGKVLQLWAVPEQGRPRSLGLLEGGRRLSLPLTRQALGADVALLAVSLEPAGGSPSAEGPTGPILYKGGWVRVM
ncbi:anti-sigma factor [Massilia sp. UMI-21]|nr:anti-sigma factor [Massilia sp. UMI-21]